MSKPFAVIQGLPDSCREVYSEPIRQRLREVVDLRATDISEAAFLADEALLGEVEVLLGTWGVPELNEELLAKMPKLKAVFYAAGSVKGFVTDAFWSRGVPLVSAAGANAVPVAEYTVGVILLSLKRFFQQAEQCRQLGTFKRNGSGAGNFRTTIGIISLGVIGRLVIRKLQAFDHKVVAFDPYAPEALFRELGVERVGLEELFARSHVASLHAPWLPETEKMIGRPLLEKLQKEAVFINTSRGALVNEADLISVLTERPDLLAILDVTYPEPPVTGSPLYSLPNVILTPHIAGSMGNECARMGELAVDELSRWLGGAELQHEVTREQLARMA